jgi:hypothetical protein
MKKILLTLLVFAAFPSLAFADGFSSLEEQMTGKEFTEAGLGKLSEQELDALNDWIRRHSLATLNTPTEAPAAAASAATATAAGGDRRGLSKDVEDDSPIRSAILGEFDGWDGQTVFKLENGMIWVQADKDTFYVKDIENPVAVIEPGMFNTWHLHVEGHRSKTKVRRIQ